MKGCYVNISFLHNPAEGTVSQMISFISLNPMNCSNKEFCPWSGLTRNRRLLMLKNKTKYNIIMYTFFFNKMYLFCFAL